MKVLVTGATGRVGANLVRHLLESGTTVKAMVMPADTQRSKLERLGGVEVVEAELGDQRALDYACRDVTHVVHLAAQLVRGDTPVDRFYDINALGTLRLLEAVAHSDTVERFVLASTDGVYRPAAPPALPLTEDTPQHPADYYGTSKLLGEVILRNHAAQFDIPYSIVRFATVVSPEEAITRFRLRALRALVQRAELGRDSNLWPLFQGQDNLLKLLNTSVGDADPDTAVAFVGPDGASWSTHFLDVRDAVTGLYLALTEPAALGQVFNVAAAAPTSHVDGAEVIANTFCVPKLVVSMPMTWRLEISIDAARRHLGFRPAHDFRSMVEAAHHGTSGVIPARL